MPHSLAVTRNRTALLAIVATIVALIGGREGGAVARRLRRAALALLRPAEAAARRLIVMAAQGLVLAPRPTPVFAGVARAEGSDPAAGLGPARRAPAFRLVDRWKRFRPLLRRVEPLGVPRIRHFGASPFVPIVAPPPAPAPPSLAIGRPDPDALVDAGRLRQRLAALEGALGDLGRQARRLARWRARQAARAAATPTRWPRPPLRPGRPPGWRNPSGRLRPEREVDVVLRECHAFALEAIRADTS